jgi:hypothetical protein
MSYLVVALMGTPLGKDEILKMKDETGASSAMLGASSLTIERGIVFYMNEFFRKSNYEYLLEQISENERFSMGAMWITGNSQERKTAPISSGKALGSYSSAKSWVGPQTEVCATFAATV